MDVTPILKWWLALTLFGLVGWPLAYSLLRHLPDRGYAFARPLGFLLTGYILWLGGSFRLLQNNLGGLLIALILAALLGWLWRRQQWQAGDELSLRAWLKREWRYVVSVELLFHAAFIGWTIYRAYDPNIETAGGEKWMEIAFINGTLRSDYFPPQDPWLSGFGISYYYFGYVLMAMVTRLTGLISTVAFNLYIPTLLAMTLTAAFGIVANLVSLHQNQSPNLQSPNPPTLRLRSGQVSPSPNLPIPQSPNLQPPTLQSPITLFTGFVAALFVGLMGNLQGLLEVLHKRGLLSPDFWAWLDIRDIKVPPQPSDSWLPDRFIWWWRGSRVLTDYNLAGREQEVIDEFPFFSFLLGDVHPHVLALPFVLLAVGLALNLLANRRAALRRQTQTSAAEPDEPSPPANLITRGRDILLDSGHNLIEASGGRVAFVIYAIAIGGLSFLNTWDFPIYLSVVGLAFIIWLLQRERDWSVVLPTGIVGTGLLGLLGVILYLPFYATFQSQAGGILPNLWNPTRLPQFFVFFGPFLVAVISLLIVLAADHRGWVGHISWTLPLMVMGPILVMILVLITLLISPAGQNYIQGILNDPNVQTVIGEATVSALIQESFQRRLTNPWTFLLLGSLVGLALALGLGYYYSADAAAPAETEPRLVESFVLILALVGLGLPLAVEFVYLRDNFGIRMNTVFKFYFQAWVLLALASAFAVYYVPRKLSPLPSLVWQGTLAVLVAAAMIYPALATANKTNYFANEPTLNGIRWVSQHRPGDYAAIEWLRANAPDDAVILEAPGSGYAAYQYTGRVSALTGLPTLLGWGGHQSQWRGNYDEPARREPDIDTLFNSRDLTQTQSLLDQYDIDYVYVGPLERERYNPQGLQKFEQLMEVVFQQDDVVIYGRS